MRTMSQQKRDYYEVLGIDKTADPATIKKAYRKLAKKYHPDSNVGNEAAAEKFKEVNEAYDILSDPEKKKLYDQFGHAAFDGTGAAGAGSYGANGGFGSDGSFTGGFGGFSGNGGFRGFHTSDGHTFHFEGGEGDDIFGDIFGNMFGGGKKSRFTGGFHQDGSGFNGFHGYSGFGADPSSEKGSDAQAEINISFDDAAFGADRVITFRCKWKEPKSESPYPCRYQRRPEHPPERKRQSWHRRRRSRRSVIKGPCRNTAWL